MKALFSSLFILFILLNSSVKSQGEAALSFLLLQPSPSLSAIGQTGTALPTDDPFGFIWNPAQLGYTSQNNNISTAFYPLAVKWLPVFSLDQKLNSKSFNAGYNFKDLIGIPLSIGIGYSNLSFKFDHSISGPSGPFPPVSTDPEDSYDAYSVGLGIDYIVQLNIGYTYKNITSEFLVSNSSDFEKIETSATDFGLLLNIPITRLINKELSFPLNHSLDIHPIANFSLGYTLLNYGDEVFLVDPAQTDPLPRTSRLGYGITTTFDLAINDFRINALSIAFTVEAEDILVGRDLTSWEYQSPLSDLDFGKNLIGIRGDSKIVSHAGTKLEFGETFSYSFGHFDGRGFDMRETNGYELRTKGLFKLWAHLDSSHLVKLLKNHIDIRYYNTNYFANHFLETKLTGIAIHFQNLNSLFKY